MSQLKGLTRRDQLKLSPDALMELQQIAVDPLVCESVRRDALRKIAAHQAVVRFENGHRRSSQSP